MLCCRTELVDTMHSCPGDFSNRENFQNNDQNFPAFATERKAVIQKNESFPS
jgi:hypothetical protein